MMVHARTITAAIAIGILGLAGTGAMPGSSAATSVQFEERWGDLNCNGEVESVEAMDVLKHVTGARFAIPEGMCQNSPLAVFPETMLRIEGGTQVQWADADCDGKISSVDALWLLREVAGLPRKAFAGCPEIGAMTTLSHVQPLVAEASEPVTFEERWGDLNCSGELQPVDALHVLRNVIGPLAYIPEGICWDTQLGMFPETMLEIEGGPQVQWADVDCNGKISSVDALWILRYVVGLGVPEFAGCPEIGAVTTLSFVQ
jgi:hypothetical protein